MPHAGDLVAEMLVRYGIDCVFGQPGGQTAALYDGIARRAPKINHVLIRDERSAGYAADAYARLTGRPGIVDVTVGPGTTKLPDGLLESYNASDPDHRHRGRAPDGLGAAARGRRRLAGLRPAAVPQVDDEADLGRPERPGHAVDHPGRVPGRDHGPPRPRGDRHPARHARRRVGRGGGRRVRRRALQLRAGLPAAALRRGAARGGRAAGPCRAAGHHRRRGRARLGRRRRRPRARRAHGRARGHELLGQGRRRRDRGLRRRGAQSARLPCGDGARPPCRPPALGGLQGRPEHEPQLGRPQRRAGDDPDRHRAEPARSDLPAHRGAPRRRQGHARGHPRARRAVRARRLDRGDRRDEGPLGGRAPRAPDLRGLARRPAPGGRRGPRSAWGPTTS